jgi:hypothetical protein
MTKRKNTCEHCVFFEDSLGECRKNPPFIEGFPAVMSTDWCGAFSLNEFSDIRVEEVYEEPDVDGFSSKQEYDTWRNVL